jgi:hypothetical protein
LSTNKNSQESQRKEILIMKKGLGILLAVFLCLAFASTSMAFIGDNDNGHGDGVWTCKMVMIFAGAKLCTSTAAESDAITLQVNLGTRDKSRYWGCPWRPDRPESYAKLLATANGNAGVAAVNNASGNFNNQGNTVAGTLTAGESDSLAHAVAMAFQGNLGNRYRAKTKIVEAGVVGSANCNIGVVGINNAAGSQNNQTNTVAIAAGLETRIALSEAVLHQATMCGKVCVKGGLNSANIVFSVNGNHGVVGVNNSAGAQNNQANVVAIAGTHP